MTSSAPPAELTPSAGKSVFADDFHDSKSGWGSGVSNEGTRFSYGAHSYRIVASKGFVSHVSDAPYRAATAQISIAVTGTQQETGAPRAGFGVLCKREGDGATSYEFLIDASAHWIIERRGSSGPGQLLTWGDTPLAAGSAPVTVQADCLTAAGSDSTRLVMFINGATVADFTDRVNELDGAGWFPALIMRADSNAGSAVVATHFEVRSLG